MTTSMATRILTVPVLQDGGSISFIHCRCAEVLISGSRVDGHDAFRGALLKKKEVLCRTSGREPPEVVTLGFCGFENGQRQDFFYMNRNAGQIASCNGLVKGRRSRWATLMDK